MDPQAGPLHVGFLRTCDLRQVSEAAELAAAVELPVAELPSVCDVFAAWQRADVQALLVWAEDQLMLERFCHVGQLEGVTDDHAGRIEAMG